MLTSSLMLTRAATSMRARTLHTSSRRLAVRTPRSSSSASASASQPVFKRDAPPAPAPPSRPPPASFTQGPASSSSSAAATGSSASSVKPAGRSGGKPGSVFASYKALPYRTKLVFWMGGAMFAALGLLAADKLEELFPARNNKSHPTTASTPPLASGAKFIDHPDPTASASQQDGGAAAGSDGKEARKPKLFSISVVDRS